MSDLVRFNKVGWVVVGLGMALGVWRAVSCGEVGGRPCPSEDRTWIFLSMGSLSVGGGLALSILSNEVEEEVLWKRIVAALVVIVATVVVTLLLSLRVIFTPLGR